MVIVLHDKLLKLAYEGVSQNQNIMRHPVNLTEKVVINPDI
jgi:hypothetical protein